MFTDKIWDRSFFGGSRIYLRLTLMLVFILALGIRLYDLTDPPLDFHSTRQLYSAIIARGMFYQGKENAPAWKRELAVESWKNEPSIEPSIFEGLVAFTYRLLDREILWIARIYSAIFWLVGGYGLYRLAREMTSIDGGVIAVIFYLFVPFGAVASRSFQPDPLMVMWIILAWWSFYRWFQKQTWRTAITAGLFAGIAMLVKSVAVFLLFGGMAGLILTSLGLKTAIKNVQVWIIAGLAPLPVLGYTLYGLYALEMGNQFKGRFFPELLLDPAHYVRWVSEITSMVGFSGLLLGLLGVMLFKKPHQRALIIGFWVGYIIYGFLFPYHFITHNYYHLPLIPLVAICLAPAADGLFRYIVSLDLHGLLKLGIFGVVLLGIGFQMWDIRVELASNDYRHEPDYWADLGDRIGRGHNIIALTQDYGYRILYYGWLPVMNWPETKQIAYRELRSDSPFDFNSWFDENTQDIDYFLVTRIKDFNRQSQLNNMLTRHYEIIDQGDGFILFDLTSALP